MNIVCHVEELYRDDFLIISHGPRDRKLFENELEIEKFINCSENEEWSKEY